VLTLYSSTNPLLQLNTDPNSEMNQEEADQDVADEVSEEVDSRGEVMRSERNDW